MGGPHWIASVLIVLWQISLVRPQCNAMVTVQSIHLLPNPFRGTLGIFPDGTTCIRETDDIICTTPNTLTDNIEGPNRPDLNSEDDRLLFVAWQDTSTTPYLSITPSNISTAIATIDLYILNYPADGISLPNLELYETSSVKDPPPGSAVEFDLISNNQLSQTDSNVRKVTLRLKTPRSFVTVLLKWTFTGLINVEWFAMSEFVLCADQAPDYNTQSISFLTPEVPTTTIVPRTEFLNSTPLILTCTVSNPGSFEWSWRKELADVANSSATADGTRTTKLSIIQINFSDAGTYFCEAKFSGVDDTYSREFNINFPKTIKAAPSIGVFLDLQQSVNFSCEAHGYFTNPVSVTWTKDGSSGELTNSSKYSITCDVGTNELIFSDGESATSSVSFLTIMQLSENDIGSYTCSVGELQFTTELSIMDVAPSSESMASTSTGMNTSFPTRESSMPTTFPGVIVGAVTGGTIVVVVSLAIFSVLCIICKARRSKRTLSVTSRAALHQHRTGDNVRWETSNVFNSMYERNGVHDSVIGQSGVESLYASIKRGRAPSDLSIKRGRAPSDLSQHKESDAMQPLVIYDEAKPENLYDEAKPVISYNKARPMRRMTNSSIPNLAKLKTPESLGLNKNPIYESTGNSSVPYAKEDQQQLQPSLDETDCSVLYAMPMNKTATKPAAEHTLDPSSEPVYSETLTPAMFCESVQTTDNVLHPTYGPIYAEPQKTNPSSTCLKEVSNSSFRELRHIGVGYFGEVVLAETVGLSKSDLNFPKRDINRNVSIQVAIKKLKKGAEMSIHEAFNKEIKFMSGLKNDNIIRLLAVGRGSEPFIMMEYMERGDLNQVLNGYDAVIVTGATVQGEGRKINVASLVHASLQVANGMKYLASHNYVHRDLATRNCLVGKDFVVKIGDFGMSRSLYGCSYYVIKGHAMLPVRWMATECFYGKFSEKTDVWAFGITMWEMFTMCRVQPYEDFNDQDLIKDVVKGGERRLLAKPKACPDNMHQVMLRCWEYNRLERAGFDEVHKMLSIIYQDIS